MHSYEKAVTEEGLNKVTFSSEQTTKLNELAESVRNDWVTNNADKFDSQALFDFTAALFAEESKLAMKARDGNTKTK
ncbi:hypothetical protein BOW50_10760 [Solemya velum gill symbiont]|uniref:hypothetical protein n=1 Tax=Solemya velum gill symbiont TaxID=2340 RepID=UPI0009984C78|nr:hypothetical protein [Solemya velum gill symbiont]OOZ75876.1 hypothetical protein BOW50_10760 [Solemya velum gill symbiont]